MAFPSAVREDALIACGRHCCLCHKFCGTKIELHHIKPRSDGGQDTFENCIPLCFDCHADMSTYDHKHPKGSKYTEGELIRHRDSWYEKVRASAGVFALPEHLKLDVNTFRKAVELLPWKGSISFVRNHYFANPFQWSEFDDFYKYWEECDDPAFEFIAPDMEGLRGKLLHAIAHFVEHASLNTFPVGNSETRLNGMPSAHTKEDYQLNGERINSLMSKAKELSAIYDEFIKLGRRKYGI